MINLTPVKRKPMHINNFFEIASPAFIVAFGLTGQTVSDPDATMKMVRDYGWFAPIVGGIVWAITLVANRITKYIDNTETCLSKLTEASVAKTELIRALLASQKVFDDRQIAMNEKLTTLVAKVVADSERKP
jgi:hypothetical protein